jgi:hypothetical protein
MFDIYGLRKSNSGPAPVFTQSLRGRGLRSSISLPVMGYDVDCAKPRSVVNLAAIMAIVVSVSGMAGPARASETSATRGACEAALSQEWAGLRPASSREPCHRAFRELGSAEDLRNEVASLMSPAAMPSTDDLAGAALIIDAAVHKAPSEPWGYLARCDVARRLGSAATLTACFDDLRRVAPQHPATLRELARPPVNTSAAIWLLRVLLGLGLLATAAHAVGRRALRAGVLGVAVAFVTFAAPSALRAAPQVGKSELSDFPVDDADPEAGIPDEEARINRPLEFGYFLQDLAAKAERAEKRGDYAAEIRYDRALTKAAPTSAFGPRKLCAALAAGGDVAQAIAACRTAITRPGATADDFERFVTVVLSSKAPLPAGERKELDAVVLHLASEAQSGARPTMLKCDVALRFRDMPALELCTAELERLAPNDPKTISFEWALALENRDGEAARRLIDRAKSTGMNSAGVSKMEAGTRVMARRRAERLIASALAALLIAAALWLGWRRIGTRRQLPA